MIIYRIMKCPTKIIVIAFTIIITFEIVVEMKIFIFDCHADNRRSLIFKHYEIHKLLLRKTERFVNEVT